MVSGCYYRLNDAAVGPVSYEELVSLAAEAVLNPGMLVRIDQQENWIPAGDVAGLFHKAGRAEDVSRWRAERRKEEQEAEVGIQRVEERKEKESNEAESPGLRREIRAAAYEAALQWQAKHQPMAGAAVTVERESRLGAALEGMVRSGRQGLLWVLSLPFVLLSSLWSRTGIELTLPKWLGRSLDVLFSQDSLIFAFRWGMTLAIPNLVAWGILSWSNMEAQRYPLRDPSQISPKMFPVWGVCSSEGEFLFLLIDLMLIVAVATYIGIRWLEAKADD